jgi:deoxyribonuclease-4
MIYDQIIKGLNEVLTKNQRAQIALETMAGKGTELGKTLPHQRELLDVT